MRVKLVTTLLPAQLQGISSHCQVSSLTSLIFFLLPLFNPTLFTLRATGFPVASEQNPAGQHIGVIIGLHSLVHRCAHELQQLLDIASYVYVQERRHT